MKSRRKGRTALKASPEEKVAAPPRDDTAPVRGSYRLMFDPVFGPFFWGKVLSSFGVWIYNIVAAIVAFQITGSALVVGLVSVMQFAPQLLFAPLMGKMADRGNETLQIVLGRLLTAIGSGGLAFWIWLTGVEGLPAATLLASSLVVGLGFVVGGPAMQSIVPTMIRPGEMVAAVALNNAPVTLARAGGPAFGALVATQSGPAAAFAIAATVNLLYALIILALRLPGGSAHANETDFSVRAALRHLRSDRPLFVLLVGIAAVGLGAEPSVTLAPPLAEHLGGGASLVGWLASSFGIGAGVGFVLFAPLHRRLALSGLATGGLLLMAGGLILAAASSVSGVALASFGITGFGFTLALTGITTQILDRSPEALRGRIMALWFVGFLGIRPFAAGFNGYLADVASVDLALITTAAVVIAVAHLARPERLSTSKRNRSTIRT